ncbi:hypothetical protein DERP_007583 [Dermatophagoides pteronyssinus]|uniref:Uncharacterized protein n=1 Tax=Dermatophagoides pteronyssinus TaxID=6956 RepID=A0ABQ8JK61_DERPT|nr:hypothetical protein DERP_007583 [Dermatophagoides pteronyssinus]
MDVHITIVETGKCFDVNLQVSSADSPTTNGDVTMMLEIIFDYENIHMTMNANSSIRFLNEMR